VIQSQEIFSQVAVMLTISSVPYFLKGVTKQEKKTANICQLYPDEK
jgi:hypothetical protein